MHRLALTAVTILGLLLLSAPVAAEDAPQRLDINEASAADLMMLKGIGPKTAEKILAQRDRVDGFKHLREITEVKGIGEKTYQRVACVFMVPQEGPQPCEKRAAGAAGSGKVNVNLADAQALTALSGIGPKKAERIVAYRQANGWFTAAEDLQGVNGIGPKTVQGLAGQVVVIVDVNRVSEVHLTALGFGNAAAIVRARDAAGGFTSLDDLRGVPGTDKKVIKRARHILTFSARD